MSTPHISSQPGDFAPTVIMPGDPMRSQRIAQSFLSEAKLVNNVRGIQGYTGTYAGRPVSVMASGMGGPSMGIYSHELFAFYGVKTIIRVGTAGGLLPEMKLGDVIIAQAACTNSNFVSQFKLNGTFSPIADFDLLCQAAQLAKERHLNYRVGNVITSDYFYNLLNETADWAKLGVLGCEMETAILYTNAALHKARALSMLTVSDTCDCQEMMTPAEREQKLDDVIELALGLA